MKLRRDFMLNNSRTVKNELRAALNRFRSMDNQPGDLDPRSNRLAFGDNGTVKVVLDGRTFTERYQNEEGGVHIDQYTAPSDWSILNGTAEGVEVSRDSLGHCQAEQLNHFNAKFPGFRDFYVPQSLSGIEAAALFTTLEALFDG
jgi:hypothetical protein